MSRPGYGPDVYGLTLKIFLLSYTWMTTKKDGYKRNLIDEMCNRHCDGHSWNGWHRNPFVVIVLVLIGTPKNLFSFNDNIKFLIEYLVSNNICFQ